MGGYVDNRNSKVLSMDMCGEYVKIEKMPRCIYGESYLLKLKLGLAMNCCLSPLTAEPIQECSLSGIYAMCVKEKKWI